MLWLTSSCPPDQRYLTMWPFFSFHCTDWRICVRDHSFRVMTGQNVFCLVTFKWPPGTASLHYSHSKNKNTGIWVAPEWVWVMYIPSLYCLLLIILWQGRLVKWFCGFWNNQQIYQHKKCWTGACWSWCLYCFKSTVFLKKSLF